MKRAVRIFMVVMSAVATTLANAQTKIDEERMDRDIEIAENVLGTMLRQQFGKRHFFPFEVKGNYTSGFGVTFRIPTEFNGPMTFVLSDRPGELRTPMPGNFSYSYNLSNGAETELLNGDDCVDCERKKKGKTVTVRSKSNNDSLSTVANQKVIETAKDFLADYGDLISQLGPDEKIMITNRGEGQPFWFTMNDVPKRKFMSLEANKSDITALRQGKMTRPQFIQKIHVVDSESTDELNPDLELLSSIFNRLYRHDLSKTYYTEGGGYYERLKDYGVIYYMEVYSSNENDYRKFNMPTLGLEDIDKATRDKKVTELYPQFEKDLKENMVEYGRTLKSLNDNEVLVLNIRLTKCDDCGIPSTLELSVKESVLKDYSSGKITRDAAVAKINAKKGPAQ